MDFQQLLANAPTDIRLRRHSVSLPDAHLEAAFYRFYHLIKDGILPDDDFFDANDKDALLLSFFEIVPLMVKTLDFVDVSI